MNGIAKDIIKEFGLEALPEDEKVLVVEKFSNLVMQAVLVRGMETLSEPQQDELDRALEKDPENFDIILDFFAEHIPNFETMVQEEVTRIRERAKKVLNLKS